MRGKRFARHFFRSVGLGVCYNLGKFSIQLACGYLVSQLLAGVMERRLGEWMPLGMGILILLMCSVLPLYCLKQAYAKAMAWEAQSFRECLYTGVLHRRIPIHSRGELEVKLRRDTQAIISFWEQCCPNALGGSIILLISTMGLIWMDGRVGVLFFAINLVQLLPILVYEGWARNIHNATCQAEEDLSTWMLEGYHGAHVLKCYGVQSWYLNRFCQLEKRVMSWGYRAEGAVTAEQVVFQAIDSLLNYGSYVMLGLFVLYGGLPVSKLPLLMILAGYLFSSMSAVFPWWLERAKYQEAWRRLGWKSETEGNGLEPLGVERTVLSCQKVSKAFGERQVLTGISLKIEMGQRVLLRGENGSGKSTLLRILLGLEGPDRGVVSLGVDRTRISYVLQEEAQTNLTVEDLAQVLQQSPGMDGQALRRHMERFGLNSCGNQPLSQLSGGQQKRFFLSAALAKSCDVLILDEPINHLDVDSMAYLTEMLQSYTGTLVVCTHMAWPGMAWDQVVELKGGATLGG